MARLKQHTLIYDDECPACRAYSQLFVDCQMIIPEGRQPYGKMIDHLKEKIDWLRASNEIALVNHQTGEVSYGIDSLFKIIAQSWPVFAPLFVFRPFRWLMRKLYFFISYNRKVIMPGKQAEYCSTCAPTMNYPYRIAYLIFAWLITSLVLSSYVQILPPLVPESSFDREFIFCGGQMLFQGIIVGSLYPKQLIYYLGHLMTVSFAGAIALLPILLLANWYVSSWLTAGYFGLVVLLMLLEHSRRLSIIQLPLWLSASWVVYRLILLLFIF